MMRHIDASRSLGVVIGLLALGGISSGTSCLVPNEDHCQFRGGDLACEDGKVCVVGVGGRASDIEGAKGDGCIAKMPDVCNEGADCVPFKYRLPITSDIRMADLPEGSEDPNTDTVEGIIAQALENVDVDYDSSSADCQALLDGFSLIECDVEAGETPQEMVDTLVAIREDAEQDPGTGCAAKAAMTKTQASCIRKYNEYLGDFAKADNPFRMACSASMGTTTGMTTEVDTTATETSAGTSTTEGPECITSEDCFMKGLLTRPICVAEVCMPCDDADGDASCAMDYPDTPACLFVGEKAGSCVECRLDNVVACTKMPPPCDEGIDACPVCDESINECVPCTAHEQCGDAACNLCTGECLPADAVVHVGGDTPDFDTLNEAVMSFVDLDIEATIIVHAGSYNEAVFVGVGRVFAFLAADGDLPVWSGTTGLDAPQLTVGPGSHVLLDGLRLSGNDSPTAPAVEVNGGHACVNRSRIIKNDGGGIWAHSNADLVVRNSFVGSGVDTIGLEVSDDASASVLYSTITASTFASTPALSCTMPMAVDVRNSIIVSQGGTSPDELSCPEAILTNTATEQEVGSFVSGWFVNFNNGDFHLTATGATAFDDIAIWQTGDPTTDIDGEDRPTSDRTAGADIP